jgi:ACS family hexuronate transporter-like MFS transporter
MFPKAAVASVTGVGGMAGAIGGVLVLLGAGAIVQFTHSYVTLFVMACLAYPIALLVLHALAPRLAPAKIES